MEERSPNSEPDGSRAARLSGRHATTHLLVPTRRFRPAERFICADWVTGNREARPGLH